ncbi:MAG: hypothetical protein U9P36_14115 [Thermodesulfobacteriota bacterium]|nr:hypothetical protein [Thermodesulfobacteriota bacterium]
MTQKNGVDSCSLGSGSTGEPFAKLQLRCLLCGAAARLEGR